jgi:hypothetical protein
MARIEWTPDRKEEAFARICIELASGKSLKSICSAPDMPSHVTVFEWIDDDESLANRYTRARERQADFIADEISDIADNATDANLARVQIDARKWKAGKLRPKVYGDRLNLDADINLNISDEQVEARLAHLLGKAGAPGAPGGEGEEEASA